MRVKTQAKSIQLICVCAVALILTGCDKGETNTATTSGTSAPTLEPEVTVSPNVIQPDAEAAYRKALLASQESASTSGLTELLFDVDGEIVQVSVQDSANSLFIIRDFVEDVAYEIDETAMMPAMLLSELDALAATGTDIGSVTSTSSNLIVVKNRVEDTSYESTYTIDDNGRITESSIRADGEILGTAEYFYEITPEGESALETFRSTN